MSDKDFGLTKQTLKRAAACIAALLFVLLAAFVMLWFSPNAYAAQVGVSGVTGSISVGAIGQETDEYDWSFSFNVGTAAPGDYVTVTSRNIPLIAPKDVTIGNGTVVGKIEMVGNTSDHPNSLNHTRTYRITFSSNISNGSITMSGHTIETHSAFIYEGGHTETTYIQVNGTTAASQSVLHPSGDWFHGQATNASPVPWVSAIYSDGTIAPYGMAFHASSGTDIPLRAGDRVVYSFPNSWLHLSLRPGYTVGGVYDGSYNHGTLDVPRSFTIISPYGFYSPNGTLYQYKILWVTDNEFAIELTRIGDLGLALMPNCILATISPLNGSSIDFANNKTQDINYWSSITRNGQTIYTGAGVYYEEIQSQEVLSDASFYAQVNTSVTNGTISPSTRQSQGSNITISYAPNEGYELESITVDGSGVSISSYPSSYTFYNTQGTHSINVRYKIKTFSLTSSVTNGTITPGAVVNWGTSKTFTYTPNSGYLLQSVTVDGSAINIGTYPDSYTFSNVRANHSIVVKYAAPSAGKSWELQP